MRIVHIEWVDSHTEVGWEGIDLNDAALDITHTVGIFLGETHNYALVAHSYDPATNEYNGRISIPLSCIKDLRTLCQIKT